MSNAPYAVIMAGGSGTRFWPASRQKTPKQLLSIVGEKTMIQATVDRLQPLIPPERVFIITTAILAEETRAQLPQLPPEQVVAEPFGRDTAACVALAALLIKRLDPTATMILLPADQVIRPDDAFQQALGKGVEAAADGCLVTYGITPRFAATGYGYVKLAENLEQSEGLAVDRVECFVEKPDAETAQAYLDEGCYRWNSGIFTWRVDTVLDALGIHTPWLIEGLDPVAACFGENDFDDALAKAYEPLVKISIDYALLEKSDNIKAISGEFYWDDLGSWDALYGHLEADEAGVIARGDVYHEDCSDCLIDNRADGVVAVVGLSGVTVVQTDGAILVVGKDKSQDVKAIVERLKAEGRNHII